jgi:hypothetical protein
MNKHVIPMCIRLSDNISDTECESLKKILDKMYYDSAEEINKIGNDRESVPAVLFGKNLGTETITKVRSEDTDQDPQNVDALFLATRTHTAIKAETTDEDPSSLTFLGTQTLTRAKGEDTDQDFHNSL